MVLLIQQKNCGAYYVLGRWEAKSKKIRSNCISFSALHLPLGWHQSSQSIQDIRQVKSFKTNVICAIINMGKMYFDSTEQKELNLSVGIRCRQEGFYHLLKR